MAVRSSSPYEDQPDREALDLERLARLHHDGGEIRVLGMQLDQVLVAPEALDRDLVADAGDDDLPILGFLGGLHRQQVTVHDACVAHGHAAHLEQVIGLTLEQAAFHVIGLVHMLLRENRRTGGNPSDERQGQLGQAGQGQGELFHARFIDRPQGVAPEPDAARGATDQLDHAFAGQGRVRWRSRHGWGAHRCVRWRSGSGPESAAGGR